MHDVLCLLHSCGDIHHTIAAVWLYLLPSELLDVALSQCCKTGEQKDSLQGRSRAWCGCQADNLILWKMLLVSRNGLDAFQKAIWVLLYLMVTIGCVYWSTERYLSVFSFAHQQFKQVWLFSVWHRLTNNWLRNWYVVFYFYAVPVVLSADTHGICCTSRQKYICLAWMCGAYMKLYRLYLLFSIL